MAGSPVHALGKCLSTEGQAKAKGGFPQLAADTYSRYAFALTLEHVIQRGYCTEKAILAAEGGAIPIYDGDTTILCNLLNCRRVIMWDAGRGAKKVARLLSNRTAYKEMWALPRFNRRSAHGMLEDFRRHALKVLADISPRTGSL
jgi:hypothetical protein